MMGSRDILGSWIRKLNMAWMPIYIFNTIPIKTPGEFLIGIDKLILKCIQKSKETRIAKTIFKKLKKEGSWKNLTT